MTVPAAHEVAVIACGNPTRCDDGLGGEVLRLLSRGAAAASPSVKLLDAGTDGAAVMFAARGCRRLIIVDACRTGAEPGAIFEVPGDELIDGKGPPLATHDFRWNHAIAAGRQIFRDAFPADVTVFLVEADSLEFGIGLTESVEAAAQKIANRIEHIIDATVAAAETAA